jgi:hypothetical protein
VRLVNIAASLQVLERGHDIASQIVERGRVPVPCGFTHTTFVVPQDRHATADQEPRPWKHVFPILGAGSVHENDGRMFPAAHHRPDQRARQNGAIRESDVFTCFDLHSMLLLVAAGLFVRTLSTLQSMPLGFNRDNVLLFELNAPQAGYPESRVADFYADLRRRLSEVPGVHDATLSHASLIRAARSHPITVNGQPTEGTRVLWTGSRFFTTMQIPIMRGREITESDRQGTLPVAVVSELFARTSFGDADPVGRHIDVGGRMRVDGVPRVLEIVGVAANARYGGLKGDVPPVVYVVRAGPGSAAGAGHVRTAYRRQSASLRRRCPPRCPRS